MNALTIAKFTFRGAFTVSILLILAACATRDVRSTAEDFFHEDSFRAANVIAPKRTPEGLVFTSYGRAGGENELLVSDDELIEIWTLESSWGAMMITSLPDEAAVLQESFANHEEGVDALWNAFDVAMRHAIESLPMVLGHGVDLKILLAYSGSGLAIQRQHLVDGAPLAFAFVAHLDRGIDSDIEIPAANHWAKLLTTVAHELLHVEHELQNLRPDRVNEETAAELFGDCAMSRFANALGAELTTDFRDVQIPVDGFPGLEDGIFAPQVQRFPSKNATLRGDYMSSIWLYHFSKGEPLAFSDPKAVDEMLRLCDRFSQYVPDFVNGETGLERIE